MDIEVVSVGSSSSGNSYIIRTGKRAIVLDAGLSCKKITNALEQRRIPLSDVGLILISHEHIDHVRSVRTLAKKCQNAQIYASRGTVESSSCFDAIDAGRIRYIEAGETISMDGLEISAFALSHDASEPLGFSFVSGGEKLSVLTDTGVVTDEIYDEICDADMLVVEANHDEDLLMYGEYPYKVKLRIKGDSGHLSNRAAGRLLADILKGRKKRREESEEAGDGLPMPVMLAHLSFNNNAPFYARRTIESILEESGFARESDYTLTIAAGDDLTVFE